MKLSRLRSSNRHAGRRSSARVIASVITACWLDPFSFHLDRVVVPCSVASIRNPNSDFSGPLVAVQEPRRNSCSVSPSASARRLTVASRGSPYSVRTGPAPPDRVRKIPAVSAPGQITFASGRDRAQHLDRLFARKGLGPQRLRDRLRVDRVRAQRAQRSRTRIARATQALLGEPRTSLTASLTSRQHQNRRSLRAPSRRSKNQETLLVRNRRCPRLPFSSRSRSKGAPTCRPCRRGLTAGSAVHLHAPALRAVRWRTRPRTAPRLVRPRSG